MNVTIIIVNSIAAAAIIAALIKDRKKAAAGIKGGFIALLFMAPLMLLIVISIALIMTFLPSSVITAAIGNEAGIKGILTSTGLGAVLHIPALIGFPLASSLISAGASTSAAAAFITSLTMVGIVTLPLEIKELGLRFAAIRNVSALILAVCIALLVGIIL